MVISIIEWNTFKPLWNANSSSSLKLGDQHDAIEELMSLSPYEMRNLLHHIMAGDEFHIDVQHSVSHSFYNVVSDREAGVSKVNKNC